MLSLRPRLAREGLNGNSPKIENISNISPKSGAKMSKNFYENVFWVSEFIRYLNDLQLHFTK